MLEEPKYIKRFRIVIAEVADHEYSVCEIYYQLDKWAVIRQENVPVVQFFSPKSQEHWEFPLEIAIEVLQKAKAIFLTK